MCLSLICFLSYDLIEQSVRQLGGKKLERSHLSDDKSQILWHAELEVIRFIFLPVNCTLS